MMPSIFDYLQMQNQKRPIMPSGASAMQNPLFQIPQKTQIPMMLQQPEIPKQEIQIPMAAPKGGFDFGKLQGLGQGIGAIRSIDEEGINPMNALGLIAGLKGLF
jgi:hypothetical protein